LIGFIIKESGSYREFNKSRHKNNRDPISAGNRDPISAGISAGIKRGWALAVQEFCFDRSFGKDD